MADSFIIMQIGDPDLDKACEAAIVPALMKNGFARDRCRRIDKHNEGGLLKSEIITCIVSADIIVADLTNERPNCYLEVGYAMGAGKTSILILTARKDHNPSNPEFDPKGKRVHFDLQGYDILFWDDRDLDGFRVELEKRIARRLSVRRAEISATPPGEPQSADWVQRHRNEAFGIRRRLGMGRSSMEVVMSPTRGGKNWNQRELLDAARAAQIKTFGWPVGVVLDNPDIREDNPQPTADGIEVTIVRDQRGTFDHWALNLDGSFYIQQDLFEQTHDPERVSFNTRIHRITEALMFGQRLYQQLGLSDVHAISATVVHDGIRGKRLEAIGGSIWRHEMHQANERQVRMHLFRDSHVCVAPSHKASVIFMPGDSVADLAENVVAVCDPLFMLFHFCAIPRKTIEFVVEQFAKGNCV